MTLSSVVAYRQPPDRKHHVKKPRDSQAGQQIRREGQRKADVAPTPRH